jgi:hypothetical protein
VIVPSSIAYQARPTSFAPCVKRFDDANLRTASGDGMMTQECTSGEMSVVELGRGRSGTGEANMSYLWVGGRILRGDSSIWSVRCCDSCAALIVCGSPGAEMEIGCGDVSRMERCLDDGDGGVVKKAKPCLHWAPFPSTIGSGRPPLNPHDCGAAPGLCSNFSRVNVPPRAWLVNECRCRGCLACARPSKRVAPVRWCPQPARVRAPSLGL